MRNRDWKLIALGSWRSVFCFGLAAFFVAGSFGPLTPTPALSATTPAPTATTTATPSPVEPASEPAVLAVAKVLPAVVNINTERIVRRQVRDPFDDFAAQFFGVYRNRPPND